MLKAEMPETFEHLLSLSEKYAEKEPTTDND